MNDNDLVARSRSGDVEAFNLLVDAYQQLIYNIALRMLGDGDNAADVAQETFIIAFQRLNTFRGGSLRAWLGQIATNLCYDRLRWRHRHPADSLDQMTTREDAPFDPPDRGESPEEYALRGELARTIEQGLASLPPEQRAVLILSDIQGFSYDEISQATNTNLGTVKSRLSRARQALRTILLANAELLPIALRPSTKEMS